MNCEVCGDSFEPVQVRKEEKESYERYITFMPKNDDGDETDEE